MSWPHRIGQGRAALAQIAAQVKRVGWSLAAVSRFLPMPILAARDWRGCMASSTMPGIAASGSRLIVEESLRDAERVEEIARRLTR